MFSRNFRQHFLASVRRHFSSKKDDPSDIANKGNVKDLLKKSTISINTHPKTPEDEWATSPYVDGTVIDKEKDEEPERYKIDPSDTSVVLFPGQGAQYVGMAKNLIKFPEVKNMFEIANEILK